MMDCIFCKIVAGEIPCYKVYEDEGYLAFLDISQITDGHTLVIPKKHVRWVWEVEDVAGYFGAVRKVALNIQKVTGKEYVPSTVFGQLVPHAHVHLLPETEGSFDIVGKAWAKAREARKLSGEEMEGVRERFEVRDDRS